MESTLLFLQCIGLPGHRWQREDHDMYRFVRATHVLLNRSVDMSVYLISEYICMKDDLQLGKLKENCFLLMLYRKLRAPDGNRTRYLLISGETL